MDLLYYLICIPECSSACSVVFEFQIPLWICGQRRNTAISEFGIEAVLPLIEIIPLNGLIDKS